MIPSNDRLEQMWLQAEPTLVASLDLFRKSGGEFRDVVIVVLDTSDEACRQLAHALSGRVHEAGGLWVATVPTARVAGALRLFQAHDQATRSEAVLDEGKMRVLFVAQGAILSADVPAFPDLPSAGLA